MDDEKVLSTLRLAYLTNFLISVTEGDLFYSFGRITYSRAKVHNDV